MMDQGQPEAEAKGGGEGQSWGGEKNRRLHQPNEGERNSDSQTILTINVHVVHMGRDILIWMRGNP